MAMLSFRVDDLDAAEAQALASRLGIDRPELLRQALRQHLDRLAGENDAQTWDDRPPDDGELSVAAIAGWGPAEDWSDWAAGAG
jgi:predicted transcriptional regulator